MQAIESAGYVMNKDLTDRLLQSKIARAKEMLETREKQVDWHTEAQYSKQLMCDAERDCGRHNKFFHMGGTGDQIRGGNAESKIQMRLVYRSSMDGRYYWSLQGIVCRRAHYAGLICQKQVLI